MVSQRKQRGNAWTGCVRALLAAAAMAFALPAGAQRVQIPATNAPAWGAPPVVSAPTFAAPPPAFDPYSVSPVAPPVYAPTGPPPASALPYAYSPPQTFAAPAAPSFGQPNAPAFGGQSPLGWQPGTYAFEQNTTYTARLRRFFARLRLEHTLLLGDGTFDALTFNRTEVASTFALPINGQTDTPLLVTPGFAFNWFDGPEGDPAAVPRGPDVPPRTYDAYVDFALNPRWTPELGAELGLRTGVWSDFEKFDDDSIRILGRGLGVVTLSPQFEVLAGVVYLDRLRVKLLPAGGVRWRPNPEWDLYLVFPNPKIRRTWFSSSAAQWWWYLAGEYGGGSWTVERPGLDDRIDYNDLRLLWGVEWQASTGATGHLEIGYAFDREIVFNSGAPPRAELDDAVLFRAGFAF